MTANSSTILVALLVAAIPLVALARRLNIPFPIVLVLGGLVLGFVPGLPQIQLNPDLVLVLFLPPLLYWEAITAPTDAMRANAGQIWLLAIGLVIATTFAVAVVAHALIASLSWPIAFILGAIVAPTDELASVPVLERFRMPRHLIATVEGESLLNDATALVIYGAAITAALSGAFVPWRALLGFVWIAAGSLGIGLVVGWLAIEGWRRLKDTQLQDTISFVVPFLAYIPAQRYGLSGVLAVVTAGVYVNRFTPTVITPAARLLVTGYWETFVFLANVLLFLLVGLQLHDIAHRVFSEFSWQSVLLYAAIVNLVVLVVRFAWIMGQEYLPVIGGSSEHPEGDWRHALVASWSGLRGAVSLAAALAIPTAIGSGHLPHRDLIIFLTFTVILVTLVAGGLTLPAVIRRLGLEGDPEGDAELNRALDGMWSAALAKIDELEREGRVDASHAESLRSHYAHRRADLQKRDELGTRAHVKREIQAEWDVVQSEREALIAMRARGEIDNTVLRRLQLSLDLIQTHLSRMAETLDTQEADSRSAMPT